MSAHYKEKAGVKHLSFLLFGLPIRQASYRPSCKISNMTKTTLCTYAASFHRCEQKRQDALLSLSLFCSTVQRRPQYFRPIFVRRNKIYLQFFKVASPRTIGSANLKSANRKNTWGLLIINQKIATFAKAPPI